MLRETSYFGKSTSLWKAAGQVSYKTTTNIDKRTLVVYFSLTLLLGPVSDFIFMQLETKLLQNVIPLNDFNDPILYNSLARRSIFMERDKLVT